jgi:hypothetical protein
MRRNLDFSRIATDLGTMSFEYFAFATQFERIAAGIIPVVREPRDEVKGSSFPCSTNHDRWARLLHGFRLTIRPVESIMETVE